MKKLALFGNKSQKSGFENLAALFSLLRSHSDEISLSIQWRYFEFLRRTIDLDPAGIETFDIYDGSADLALSIGGDGTFLTTSAAVGAYETPILGINSGHLGYLAAAELTDAERIVREILTDDFTVEERSLIAVECSVAVKLVRNFALNEVAILKQDTASMITVETEIEEIGTASYRGDGLIISTPTGSTGYNLSVGGPIVAPTAKNFIIAPIAPHSLNMRPLVISEDRRIEVSTQSRADKYLLSVDGKATELPLDAKVTLRKADHSVFVVVHPGYSFIEGLRAKLLWGRDGM